MTRTWLAALAGIGLSVAAAKASDTLIVLNKDDDSAWLIDPASGTRRAEIPLGDAPHEVAVSPDGRRAVAGNYGREVPGSTLTVLDVVQGKALRTIDLAPHRRPHGIRWLDGRRVLVTSETSRKLLEVDVETGKIVGEHDVQADVHMVEVSADGKRAFATAIGSGKLVVLELGGPAGAPKSVATGAGSEALAVRPGGREIWVGSNEEHVVRVVDASTLAVLATIECGLQPIRLAFVPDGTMALASCLLSSDLAVIDAEKRALDARVALADAHLHEDDWKERPIEEIRPLVERALREGARPIGVLTDPEGTFAYVASRGLARVAVVEIATWSVARMIPTGGGPDGLAWARIAD
ncbi:MAG: gluconolaconase [Candidatus Eiseniibacteriota bacterium]